MDVGVERGAFSVEGAKDSDISYENYQCGANETLLMIV
jgi:hypothetical protein